MTDNIFKQEAYSAKISDLTGNEDHKGFLIRHTTEALSVCIMELIARTASLFKKDKNSEAVDIIMDIARLKAVKQVSNCIEATIEQLIGCELKTNGDLKKVSSELQGMYIGALVKESEVTNEILAKYGLVKAIYVNKKESEK